MEEVGLEVLGERVALEEMAVGMGLLEVSTAVMAMQAVEGLEQIAQLVLGHGSDLRHGTIDGPVYH